MTKSSSSLTSSLPLPSIVTISLLTIHQRLLLRFLAFLYNASSLSIELVLIDYALFSFLSIHPFFSINAQTLRSPQGSGSLAADATPTTVPAIQAPALKMFDFKRGSWQSESMNIGRRCADKADNLPTEQRSQQHSSSQSMGRFPLSSPANAEPPSVASFRSLPHNVNRRSTNTQTHRAKVSDVEIHPQDCIAQIMTDGQHHGPTNSTSFTMENDTGYLQAAGRRFSAGTTSSQAVAVPDASRLSLDGILRAAAAERLQSMPHRASRWDRAIRQIEGSQRNPIGHVLRLLTLS